MHFEAQSSNYARARPPYPPALWERLRDLGLLTPGKHVLDLGAGTGQATGPLLAAGVRVTAVEPGPRLAAQLRTSHPTARVVVGRAEDVELPKHSFDFAVAATSIHWMDLDVVLPKIHRMLAPGGMFLVWRNVFGDPSARLTPFRQRVAEIVRARKAPVRPGPDWENVEAATAELTKAGLFTAEDTATFRWSLELDDAQVHRLFSTFSDWTADEVDRAAKTVRELEGKVVEHYSSWLIGLRTQQSPVQ